MADGALARLWSVKPLETHRAVYRDGDKCCPDWENNLFCPNQHLTAISGGVLH